MTLRDIVLARFVPGYAIALRQRDLNFYQDISVTMGDLDLLCKYFVVIVLLHMDERLLSSPRFNHVRLFLPEYRCRR